MIVPDEDSLRTEAIARITWGDAPSDVGVWLLENGMSPRDAKSLVRQCVRQRSREMRALGTRNLIHGTVSLIATIVCALPAWYLLDWLLPPGGVPGFSGKIYGVVFIPAFLFGAYACQQLWLAFDRLVFGAWAGGAVSDLEN